MKKNLIKTSIRCFITFFSILYANNNYAQQLSINYKGANISIPRFNEDSTLPFINWYTKNNIIYPIKQSTADWEIRMMKVYPHKGNGSIYQIVGIKDSVYFNKITFSESYAKDSVFRPDKLVNIEGGSWGLFRQIITVLPIKRKELILQELITNRLFDLKDFDVIQSSQKKKKIVMIKPPISGQSAIS